MEKHLRVLTVTLDYPPPVLGGYGVMCSQVCAWLRGCTKRPEKPFPIVGFPLAS